MYLWFYFCLNYNFYLWFLGFFSPLPILCCSFLSCELLISPLLQNGFRLNKKPNTCNRNDLIGIQTPAQELLFQFWIVAKFRTFQAPLPFTLLVFFFFSPGLSPVDLFTITQARSLSHRHKFMHKLSFMHRCTHNTHRVLQRVIRDLGFSFH